MLQRPCNRWERYQSILALTNERKFGIVININFNKMQHACALFWIMAARGLYSCLPPDQIPLMSLMVVVAAMNCNCNLFFIDQHFGVKGRFLHPYSCREPSPSQPGPDMLSYHMISGTARGSRRLRLPATGAAADSRASEQIVRSSRALIELQGPKEAALVLFVCSDTSRHSHAHTERPQDPCTLHNRARTASEILSLMHVWRTTN